MNTFDLFKTATRPQDFKPVNNIPKAAIDETMKGILMNNYIKKGADFDPLEEFDTFEYTSAMEYDDTFKEEEKNNKKSPEYNMKKALMPLGIVSLATIGAILTISAGMAKYSKTLNSPKGIVRPPDLPISMNILEEYHLAVYRALRDPSSKNIKGLIGVGLFSGIVLSAKSLVDGIKDVWIKKQKLDIDYDFQNKMIEIERDSFSGKLNVVNSMLKDKTKFFKDNLNFKGNLKEEDKKEDEKDDKNNKKTNLILLAIAGVAVFGLSVFALFKNFEKISSNLSEFKNKMDDIDIKSRISNIIENNDKESALDKLTALFKTTNASEAMIEKEMLKVEGTTQKEVEKILDTLRQERIYTEPPEALGGKVDKIQYYCYVNEERGFLYNWIIHPENKWNKYLFLCLCAVSSIAYISRTAADAIKNVAVEKENKKNELEVKRRLVKTEINNFKAKKQSAIEPMIDNFRYQKDIGKSNEELSDIARNILIEIKNGPPYVYN